MQIVRLANHSDGTAAKQPQGPGSTIAAHALQLIDRLDRRLSPGRNGEEARQVGVHRRYVTFYRQTQARRSLGWRRVMPAAVADAAVGVGGLETPFFSSVIQAG